MIFIAIYYSINGQTFQPSVQRLVKLLAPMSRRELIFDQRMLVERWCLNSHYFLLEGGRLQKELEYVESTLGVGAGATNELIIQTPRESESGSILTTDALLTHLEVIKAASRVVVEKEDV